MIRGQAVAGGDDGVDVVLDGRSQPVRLPNWYVTTHVRQEYSLTAHRAQGATVDWALTLFDDAWYRELGYSALSQTESPPRST